MFKRVTLRDMRVKPKTGRRFLHLLAIAAPLFAFILLFRHNSTAAEWYMRKIYPLPANILSFVSSLFPFSRFDLSIAVALVLFLVAILLSIMGRMRWPVFFFHLSRFVVVTLCWFYFGWGVAYFRENYHTRADVAKSSFNSEDFSAFVMAFIAQANASYVDVNNLDRRAVVKEIEARYGQLSDRLNLNYPNGRRRVKRMMFEPFQTKTGISGYFGPFFNEVHVNEFVLDYSYPFTVAHEMAHQFGIASEAEANLYAFMVCSSGENPTIRYSAYYSVIGYLLNNVRTLLPDAYETIYQKVKPEIVNDLHESSRHWKDAAHKRMSEVQSKIYDGYLKSNRVHSGRKNYSEVVSLLVSAYNAGALHF